MTPTLRASTFKRNVGRVNMLLLMKMFAIGACLHSAWLQGATLSRDGTFALTDFSRFGVYPYSFDYPLPENSFDESADLLFEASTSGWPPPLFNRKLKRKISSESHVDRVPAGKVLEGERSASFAGLKAYLLSFRFSTNRFFTNHIEVA
jgi:hypothetical protein